MDTEARTVRGTTVVARGARPRPDMKRMWVYPVAFITLLALLVFFGFYALDVSVFSGVAGPSATIAHYLDFNPGYLEDALPALGMTIVAVFGIVLTVVALIVQLSSDRYTGVALMFLRDRINIAVMSYYVFASVCAIWLSVSLQDGFVARGTMLMVMVFASVGLAMMLPYFAYVFWFLEPGNIIDRIRYYAGRDAARGRSTASPGAIPRLQSRVLNAMEEITDIANNSIFGKDKIITSRAVDALRDLVLEYLDDKPDQAHDWYTISEGIRRNPDFAAMEDETMQEIQLTRLWVEWKALRQYLGVYNEAMTHMQDITYLIAIDTRYIGEAAASREDRDLLDMVYRFMNSYLRAAINARSTRTAYNVLHQYRKLVESVLGHGLEDSAFDGVAYMKYYGHVSFEENLPFITETVAYDLAALCQHANEARSGEAETRMLKQFLDLDRPTRGYRQERGLRGVRKAQVKLAAYYLSVGAEANARLIAKDMLGETPELLHSIHHELGKVEAKQFWETVDRGRNFEYMPPDHREQLGTFFGWMDAAPPPRRRATDR